MPRLTLLALSSLALSLVACGPGSGGSSSGDGDGDDGASGTESESQDEGETGEPQWEPTLARGITVDRVTANQGVAVPIFADGAWVGGGGRNAQLVQSRVTFLRAYWAIDPGWQPREIKAQLTLTQKDGTVDELTKTLLIDGDPDPADLEKTFWFGLPDDKSLHGAKYQIALYETEPGWEEVPDTLPTPLAPAEPELIGFEDSYQVLRVTIVPIDHDIEGESCPTPADVTENDLKIFTEQLHMQNPSDTVEVTLREPAVYTASMNNGFGGLLSFLGFDLRFEDGADTSEYYYGVVRACDGGPSGVGGQAIDIPQWPTKSNQWSRTSVGRWYGSAGQTANTMVHEVGHSQGLRHVACSGGEGGADPSYPYAGGAIGVWGFGIVDFSLHSPEAGRDYMTYCGNSWVSDWTWAKVFPVVQEISSWDFEGGAGPDQDSDTQLVGALYADGTEEWFALPGAPARVTTPGHSVEFVSSGGQIVDVPASLTPRPHSDDYNVVVSVPNGVEDISAITRVASGQRVSVDPTLIRGPKSLTL